MQYIPIKIMETLPAREPLVKYIGMQMPSQQIYSPFEKMGRKIRPTVRFALRVAKYSLITVSLRAEICPLITVSVKGRDIPTVKP